MITNDPNRSMSYPEFLLCCLMRVHNATFDALPYDIMFGEVRSWFERYDRSEHNVDTAPEYECMEAFLVAEKFGEVNFDEMD